MIDAFKTNGSSPPKSVRPFSSLVWLGISCVLAPWLAALLISLAVL